MIAQLKSALAARVGFTVVMQKVTDTAVTWEGRIPPQAKAQWKEIQGRLLEAAEQHGFYPNLDLSIH